MENSLYGVIIAFAVISTFILGLTNFVFMFPGEQGFTYNVIDNQTYVVLNRIEQPNITDLEASLETGFDKWDIEVGFMGSNTQKASKSTGSRYITQVTNMLKIIINEVFTTSEGSVHPFVAGFLMFVTVLGIFLTLIFIKFLRTGA